MPLNVLLARQRSGTGALGTVLDQHPDIKYMGEVFHHDAIGRPPNYFWFIRRKLEKDPDIILPNEGPRRFDSYAKFLQNRCPRTHAVIDIKYASTHHFNGHWVGVGEPPTLFKILAARAIPIVHLLRTNYLKAFVSGRLAELNGVWHARKGTEITVRNLHLDIRACLWYIEKQTKQEALIRDILKAYPKRISLTYEDIFTEDGALKESVAEQLAIFFGVTAFVRRTPVTVKQTSDRLRDVLENFDAVGEALAKTPYAWMLSG
ncbi:MAG: hypothetical protein ACREHF_10345 [Rhizomicrobium sp.]